ncbi:hypothetical protein GJ496_008731 [Pomphorhynchus laevis]|nr:hypothetical protein GJ496_008731 [Pomphorhynchus laevis]
MRTQFIILAFVIGFSVIQCSRSNKPRPDSSESSSLSKDSIEEAVENGKKRASTIRNIITINEEWLSGQIGKEVKEFNLIKHIYPRNISHPAYAKIQIPDESFHHLKLHLPDGDKAGTIEAIQKDKQLRDPLVPF